MSSPIFPNISVTGIVGEISAADGVQAQVREGRLSDVIVSELQGRYYEMTKRQRTFAAYLATTSSTVAAGNISGAAAAASTQFAVWNPQNSGVDLVLLKVWCAIISGTFPAAPMSHNFFNASAVSISGTAGAIQSSYGNQGRGGVAKCLASAAGSALTGGGALTAHRPLAFDFTAAAYSDAGGAHTALEVIDGDIIIPPGSGWVPCFSAAGTTLLNAWGATWAEVPI